MCHPGGDVDADRPGRRPLVPARGLLRGARSAASATPTATAPATSPGLTEKLDYLEWLGVDCLWLLPFYQSPLRDGGYDISDFFTVLPEYGDVDDAASSSRRRTAAASGSSPTW